MHRFFADERGLQDGVAFLGEEDSQHALRVLRLTPGDEIELVCPPERYLARIEGIDGGGVRVRALSPLRLHDDRRELTGRSEARQSPERIAPGRFPSRLREGLNRRRHEKNSPTKAAGAAIYSYLAAALPEDALMMTTSSSSSGGA